MLSFQSSLSLSLLLTCQPSDKKMLFSLVVVLMVPLTLARSAVKPDHHVASRFDRSLPIANLFIALDASVSEMFNKAGAKGSVFNVRSIGAGHCDCGCTNDNSTGNTGCLCYCEGQDRPDTEPECLLACKIKNGVNICVKVCPNQQTGINPIVSILKLTKDAVHKGPEYEKRSVNEGECISDSIEDETTGNTGHAYLCQGRKIPPIGPKCLGACEFSEYYDANICLVVCPSHQSSVKNWPIHN